MARTGFTLVASLPFVLWPLYVVLRGELRWEMVTIMVLVPTFAIASPKTQKLVVALYPLGLVGLFYEWMRFVQGVGLRTDTIHDCDLRQAEMALFGLKINGIAGTVHDYLQAHPSTVLDVICAIPYGTFLYASIGLSVFLYFKDFTGVQRFGWTFFLLNIAGFATYHIYPAAPPWYFHTHGCAIDLNAAASEGPNLARVDSLLGFGYFRGFYGRSHDVFGAVPSLHVAYPLLIVREGWRHFGFPLRTLSIAYFLTMCFAAVYLDHHWILDVVIGLGYTVVVHGFVSMYFARRRDAQRIPSEPRSADANAE